MKITQIVLITALLLASAVNAPAAVVEFTNKVAWESAAGQFTTIDFTEYPNGTLITDQYSELGVTFDDGLDYAYQSTSFINDGAGLYGAMDEIAVSFTVPMTSIAIEFPGGAQIKLYNDNQLIYTSNYFSGLPFIEHFGGLISTEPFDAAIIRDPLGGVYIDDLHFGPPIPAPGALVVLAAALGGAARPRRRSAFNSRSHAVQASGSISSRRTPP